VSIWDSYESRIAASGLSKRESVLRRELHMLSAKLSDSLSFHSVKIDNATQEVAITNSDNLNEKTIYSLPSDVVKGGGLVSWMNNHWLIVECDANTEIYTKAKMRQCNHLLKWIDADGKTHEQWCIIEDGTKYLTGEYEDREFVVTRGDSRIAMTIARNEDTVKFCRESRFLIDDPESQEKLSYLLTKPLKVGMVYNTDGVYSFVLQEVVSTDDDNHELGIADYYKYFPKDPSPTQPDNEESIVDPENNIDEDGRQVWL
jgi:hypothetical protein